VDGTQIGVDGLMAEVRKHTVPAVLLNHWHLSIDEGPEECGGFSLLSQRAMDALWRPLCRFETSCEAYPTRTHLRCDACRPCHAYDRLDAAVHLIRDMREQFFIDRAAFEIRRCDLTFDEVLPDGTRLRVRLRESKTPCFKHDELDSQFGIS